MAGFVTDIHISHPPEQVFAYATDPRHATEVMADVVRIEPVTESLEALGARWKETREIKGKEHTVELEVTEYTSAERYAVSTEAEGFTVVYHFAFQPKDEGTRVELRCEVTAPGVKKLMAPLVAMALKKQDGDHLERLKAAMDRAEG